MNRLPLTLALMTGLSLISDVNAVEKSAIERGREAVRGRPALSPSSWSLRAVDEVWKQWGLKEKPANYEAAFRERYGLHPAPYDNGKLPMGLHEAKGLVKGVTTDCVLCHAGAIAGQTIIGLGNASLDLQGLFDDLIAADGTPFTLPFKSSMVRGTVDPIGPVLFLMGFRDADLNVVAPVDLGKVENLASDPPAWWLLKKKKTRNWTGSLDVRAARVDMATLLHPLNSGEYVRKQEPVFADIHEFVMSVPSPKYPFAIDRKQAEKGKEVYTANCARCHGTYGDKPTYPNKVVPVDSLGTDPLLAQALTKKVIDHVNKSWLAKQLGPDGKPYQVVESDGYQAPPLDGIWATAPYFHNGSVPTLYHVLNSKARPAIYTRSFRTDKEAYDPLNLGWKITVLEKGPAKNLPGVEQRRIYDANRPGQSNAGHVYGDKLTEPERRALIEYLKTL